MQKILKIQYRHIQHAWAEGIYATVLLCLYISDIGQDSFCLRNLYFLRMADLHIAAVHLLS